ncbi:MAG TPA: cell wall-binding repeat-containing protein [Acidimicrobiales bacterium]|nr:cell wall-binding repeat-containing protein [Acidimicrobiales bacterium]
MGRIRTGDNYALRGWDTGNPVRGKNAPSFAVNPANNNQIVESQMDLNEQSCEWNASTDGGTTWPVGGVLPVPPGFNAEDPCSTVGHGANAIDNHSAAWGSGQNVYIVWSSTQQPANAGDPFPFRSNQTGTSGASSLLLSKSTNGGQSFTTTIAANPVEVPPAEGSPPGTVSTYRDHGFPKIDVLPGGGAGGADRLVLSSEGVTPLPGSHIAAGQVRIVTSDDGGNTFSPVRVASPAVVCTNPPTAFDPANPATSATNACEQPYGGTEHTEPRFGPNGEIYVGWTTTPTSLFAATDPSRVNGFIRLGKSTDNGQTFTFTNVINVAGAVYPGPATPPYGTVPARFNGSNFPQLAVDRASGTGSQGNVYLVWQQDPHLYGGAPFQAQDHFMHNRSQVWFIRSTTGGTSFDGLRRLSATPLSPLQEHDRVNPETQTRHPQIEVAPDGRVDVVWHDRRHWYRGCVHTHVSCNEARLGDTYYTFSETAGTSFAPNRRISDRSTNNDVGFDYRFSTYWDFGPVLAHQGVDRILFGWADSREGNFENDAQDIYLAKTNLRFGRGVAPVRSVAELLPRYSFDQGGPLFELQTGGLGDPGNLSVALSQLAYPGGGEAVLAGTFASRPWTQVVVANQDDAGTILAGGVLARANLSSILLTGPGRLHRNVATEAARMLPRPRDDEFATRTQANFTPTQGSSTITCTGCFSPNDVGSVVRNSNFPPDTVITQVIDANTAIVNNTATGNTAGTITFAPQVAAFVLGNEDRVSERARQELADAIGVPLHMVKRIGGSPAAMAAQIARQMDRRATTPGPGIPGSPGTVQPNTLGQPAFDAAVIVNPASPDAAAVSTLAAARRLPVLFTDQNSLPPETSAVLADLNVQRTVVIGDAGDVSDTVVAQLTGAGRNPSRLGGGDAAQTSQVILQVSANPTGEWRLPTNQTFVGDANDPRHGALLGSSSARIGGLLLLTTGPGAGALGGEAQSVAGGLGLDPRLDRFIVSQLNAPPAPTTTVGQATSTSSSSTSSTSSTSTSSTSTTVGV